MNDDFRDIMRRMDKLYKSPPTGNWFQRWIPGVCKHERIRCIHGDEIIARRYRRRFCLVCARSLKGPLPFLCSFTGRPHVS